MNKILSYDEYQEKISNLKTPEDIAAFAQDLVAPLLARAEEGEPEEVAPTKSVSAPKTERVSSVASRPWEDVVESEVEATVIDLYAKGMTTRDISRHMRTQHGEEFSQPAISGITDKVFPLVKEWQARPLESCYPILYLDGLFFKVRDAGKITSKVAYIALGIDLEGHRDILGIWVSDSEGSKFWMQVLNDIKNRGVEDVLITSVDGLKGFPQAVEAIFPHADVQTCIAHQIRNTIKFVPHKDKKRFCDDLKTVYAAPTEDAGREALTEVTERWPQYRFYLKSWEDRWTDLAPFFSYPDAVRRMVYTTNTIENVNRQLRKVTKTTTVFPHNDALIKLLWLAQADLTSTWTMPVRHWGEAMAQMTILFPERVRI